MSRHTQRALTLAFGLTLPALFACRNQTAAAVGDEQREAALPDEVKIVWDLGKAHQESTPTRERVCLNGLWRWQPAKDDADSLPVDKWGFFKVPGFWPGTNNYIQ